ncbi:hypothetical protein CDQ84_00500 [Clostridium thermosuccinogenes]|jgi:peroxiredoxin|uniref:Aspartyl-phosphate phosphatase Spo0E family protein n=1 Tax=Clostridium thermosuccinogenes TaxID=84032 RepID=A0A2K2FN34_9CLOT|nr:aspartyl-phosphate phosphatase Spo0E family protein [Pseudoclostridium thermosuccinogenes]AUS97902.1 hypothetical protein CDO33_16490 [Pseudoclostridium thermosuccinogenes]PNT94189.1 hypothetical protein CDQ83_12130 [Pseudoclostridium thermosuccinogenes]PNU00199.1 hypothetical protein CDQ85_00500 [Pseudoclostridium thermosuccinogenes]PNU01523.1 hypothetical protein CDQ84_00500 [Pseudoclostridium thermosuccinogenes]
MNDTTAYKALAKEIEELKSKLYGISSDKQLSSKEVVEMSQKLDSLIVKYYKHVYMPPTWLDCH